MWEFTIMQERILAETAVTLADFWLESLFYDANAMMPRSSTT